MSKETMRACCKQKPIVGRARGYHRHVEGKNGHRLRVLGPPGTIDCVKHNCEINQPCDSKSMEMFRCRQKGHMKPKITKAAGKADPLVGNIRSEIARIEKDERYGYPPAQVQANAPLALIQVGMKAYVRALYWVLDRIANAGRTRDAPKETASGTRVSLDADVGESA